MNEKPNLILIIIIHLVSNTNQNVLHPSIPFVVQSTFVYKLLAAATKTIKIEHIAVEPINQVINALYSGTKLD